MDLAIFARTPATIVTIVTTAHPHTVRLSQLSRLSPAGIDKTHFLEREKKSESSLSLVTTVTAVTTAAPFGKTFLDDLTRVHRTAPFAAIFPLPNGFNRLVLVSSTHDYTRYTRSTVASCPV